MIFGKSKGMKNKKGTVVDIAVLVAVIFAMAISTVVAFHVFDRMQSAMNDQNISQPAQDVLNNAQNEKGIMDYSMLFVLLGLGLFAIITAFFIDTHPAFLFISLFLVAIIIMLSAVMSNVYGSISVNSTLNQTFAEFPKTNFILNKLPFFAVIISAIVLFVMFAKYQQIPR